VSGADQIFSPHSEEIFSPPSEEIFSPPSEEIFSPHLEANPWRVPKLLDWIGFQNHSGLG
jgi:hypothetical protein